VSKKHITHKRKRGGLAVLIVLFALIAAPAIYALREPNTPTKSTHSSAAVNTTIKKASTPAPKTSSSAAVAAAPAVNACVGNTLSQNIIVSIAAQHLYVCSYAQQVYDSPVVTGVESHPDTLTPVGVYHIYAKETNVVLKGSDSLHTWSDPVSYWMPWLDNQYGAYGFHDATWRPANAFGNISPNSLDGSNGCVELPLATAKWIYDWSVVGTTVTVEASLT
jgi:lipoprotein-anchoring transpeptidase ErfK/SrfK